MASSESDQQRICQQRILQVFDYLKALNDHRNPAVRRIQEQAWSMWLDDLPDHPTISLPSHYGRVEPDGNSDKESTTNEILRVRRPVLTAAPPPPTDIRDWLRSGWDDPQNDLKLLETQNQTDDDGKTVTISFDSDPARVAVLAEWRERREVWRIAELPARMAMGVFEKLYALHGRLERESERFDLVAGDGVLSWQQQDGNIFHPLLIQRVQLIFDSKTPEFIVVDADFASELYTSIFQAISAVDPRALAARRKEFEAGGYHPLSVETNAFLAGLANQLSSQGTFVGDHRPGPGSDDPCIGRSPILFLRSRTKGFGAAIEQVIESIEARDNFCGALKNIVGCETHPDGSFAEHSIAGTKRELPQLDVLFGKPANPEQVRIARQLDHHGSVLVQGPPGTGKSHTIANLIGHLLAQGKSVLVTSQTTKALRVLRGHVVKELQPLCLSVLDSDLDSREQLKNSVQAISSRLSDSDADELEREAIQIEQRRALLIDELNDRQDDLLRARADEYRYVVFGGQGFAPSDAARKVAAARQFHDWIPSPVALGEPCPLSEAEVRQLYATNKTTEPADDELADTELPEPASLLRPEDFEASLHESAELASIGVIESRLWASAHFTTAHIERIPKLIQSLQHAVAEFKEFDGWRLATVEAGRHSARDDGPWHHLLGKIDEAKRLITETQTDLAKFRPEVSNEPSVEMQRSIVADILCRLPDGGTLAWHHLALRPRWRRALKAWRVQGRTPKRIEEFIAVQNLLAIKIARIELAMLWDGLMTPYGTPPAIQLGNEPERAADQFATKIRECLKWWNSQWQPAIQQLIELGFDWDRFLGEQPPNLDRFGEIHRIINSVEPSLIGELERTLNYLKSLYLKKSVKDFAATLSAFDRPEVSELRKAIDQSDASGYRHAHSICLAAALRRKDVIARRQLLDVLKRKTASGVPIAESWAQCIRNRNRRHDGCEPPGDVAAAWEWRQLNDELERRSRVDLEELGTQIERLKKELRVVTNELIDRRAWARQVKRTTLSQRQALMGWLGIVHRIGRGYVVRAPELRLEAQRKIEECRSAVPVWIMPLARLVESFDFRAPRFDVVIIDEASQCDVMALLALAIARTVVVVGDDKQVSPSAIGQKQELVANLIKLHLDGIPNAVLYDGKMSVYNLAKQSFPGLICLLEHFRCVPDIIQFSNYLSYDGQVKPLREPATSPIRPYVVPYRVEGGSSQGKVNQQEAVAIASLIAAATEQKAYDGQTFGVISLVGDEQALEIERLLLQHLTPQEYEQRRIICGNSAQFQGDERDVVFLSVVDSSIGGLLDLRDSEDFRQRYNVAASRACNQMWVVYSLDPITNLKPRDLRRRLIEHAQDPAATVREIEKQSQRTESPFEKAVLSRLVSLGFRVAPQWRVGRYRIDLVVEGSGQKKLAVECDGDRYHPIEKLPEDMERQAILERLGWTFIRLRGSAFYRDPDASIKLVLSRLEDMGIRPEGVARDPTAKSETDAFVAELIRRAAEIRAAWLEIEPFASTAAPIPPGGELNEDESNGRISPHEHNVEPTTNSDAATDSPLVVPETFSQGTLFNDGEEAGQNDSESNHNATTTMQPPQNASHHRSHLQRNSDTQDPSHTTTGTTANRSAGEKTRNALVNAVIELLKSAKKPMKAQDIVSVLQRDKQYRQISRRDVNSVLYNEIQSSSLAQIDGSYRWAYTAIDLSE